MSEHRCEWLEAAECAALRLAFFRANERVREPLRVLRMHLVMMCRAQFAAERSYQRYNDAASGQSEVEALLLQYLEAHAFLISANLAWDTLAGIKLALVTLRPPKGSTDEIKAANVRHAMIRAKLTTARSHIEHIAVQIRQGRSAPSYGEETSADIFGQALGRCEGTSVIFGDERFDLAEQMSALTDVCERVAPSIATLVTPSFTVQSAAGPAGERGLMTGATVTSSRSSAGGSH